MWLARGVQGISLQSVRDGGKSSARPVDSPRKWPNSIAGTETFLANFKWLDLQGIHWRAPDVLDVELSSSSRRFRKADDLLRVQEPAWGMNTTGGGMYFIVSQGPET